MHSNNRGERDMSKFVEFTRVWVTLTPWQQFRIYFHAVVQYRLEGIFFIVGSALAAIGLAMFISENIYFSLVIGGVAGVAAARY